MEWLPAADALVDMVAVHVPLLEEAQKWWAPIVYSGDIEDKCGQGISNCDAQGPTVVYISKMSSGASQKGLLTFGCVFRSLIHPGDKFCALQNGVGLAKCEEIYVAASHRMEKHLRNGGLGEKDFWVLYIHIF
eukprot:10360924-Ditylum_brightwellii.AAC.1